MSNPIDLSALVVQREPVAPPRTRSPLWTRYVLPALLLAGFAALTALAARQTLSPPRRVTVIPVLTVRGETALAEDTPLFQAAGWVEPRPAPVLVTALAEGVVERLLVVEGQEVKEGDVLARLVDADARLAVDSAQAELALRQAELDSARADLAAAQARYQHPLHLDSELATAEAALARAETEQALLPAQRRAAEVRLRAAKQDRDSRRAASSSVPAVSILRADAEYEAASHVVEELKTKQSRIAAEVAALTKQRDTLKSKRSQKVDEARQLGTARAAVAAGEARRRQAQAALDAARLRLERMTIRAPVAGRVLALPARPGSRLTGLAAASAHDTSTVALLYSPRQLQLRVDVRLDDVARVQTGQRVRISGTVLGEQITTGRVLLPTAQADVQKNTLSVKVALDDPPAVLRPDMLVQATFLAVPRRDGAVALEQPEQLLVPRQLVDEGSVWIADRLSGRAYRRPVQLGPPRGELVVVQSGLSGADKLIVQGRDGLSDGQRITVTGEDETLGIDRRAGR